MRTREQLLCAVGNLFSDLCRQLNFSFQRSLSKNPCGRKSWHLFITVLMSIIIPFFFNCCFLCNRNHGGWLSIVYYIFLLHLLLAVQHSVEVKITFITTVTESVENVQLLVPWSLLQETFFKTRSSNGNRICFKHTCINHLYNSYISQLKNGHSEAVFS